MKHMRKKGRNGAILRTASVLLVLVLCVIQFMPFANAQSIRNKKVVSIVYDDSTSMFENNQLKWAYANYAMQSFAGMLNKEDVLMMTYMSAVDKGNKTPVTIDTANREKSVEDIRRHSDANSTPLGAIDAAYNSLAAHRDGNASTQYWLVIMTDGVFNKTELSVVEKKLCELADKKMSNGTLPKIVYLSMCDSQGSFTPADNLRKNITVKKADDAKQIAGMISGISDEVSGRFSVDESEISIVNETTVKVTSEIPLINIGVLTQFSKASVTAAQVDGGGALTVESNVGTRYPDVRGRKTDSTLIGNVALIGNGGSNVPAGTYTITFSEPIDKKNIDIMFEPALELRLMLYSEGVLIDDVSRIKAGMVLDAEAKLYEMGTNNEIDLSLLPAGITHSIKHIENGNAVNATDQLKLSGISAAEVPTEILATLELPGYFSLQASKSFTPVNLVMDGLDAEVFYDGSERRSYKDKATGQMVNDAENVVYISDLETNRTGVAFTVRMNGMPIDKQTAQEIYSEFKRAVNTKLRPYETEILDDGRFLVYPTKKPGWYPSLIYWLINRGEQTISAELDGFQAEAAITVKLGDWRCIPDIWPWILLWYILSWLFVKPKFGNREIQYWIGYDNGRRNPYRSDPNGDSKWLRWFNPYCWRPYRAARFYIQDGIGVKAGRGGDIYVIGLKGKNFTAGDYFTTGALPVTARADDEYPLQVGSSCQVEIDGKYIQIKLMK